MLRTLKFQTAKIYFRIFSTINLAPGKPLNFFFKHVHVLREKWSADIFRDHEKFSIFSNNIHRSGGNYPPLSPTLTSINYWFRI